tara:strand:- start:266 stop:814 length:549 start_codon:yes stop_codon:yes gene_type:complete
MSDWYEHIESIIEAEILEVDDDTPTGSSVEIKEGEVDALEVTPEERTVNNQGFGHSQNPAPIWYSNVRHRAYYEQFLTAVCMRRKVLYLPLPLALFGNQRIEPDAIIFKDGLAQLVELDGRSHDSELASTEQQRLKPFRDHLIDIQRFNVPEDPDINWANHVLDQVLERIERRLTLMGGKND